LVDEGYTCVLWNSIPEDWMNPEGWPVKALQQCNELDHALVVLHDLPTDAMFKLEEFICRARDEGFTFCQEFPKGCVPVQRGKVLASMNAYIKDDCAM
jgi:hypothetical protein